MSTFYVPGYDRLEWYPDKDGILTTAQHENETRTRTFDYSDLLQSLGGVTISSSAWEASGVTTSSPSATTTATTVTVAGTNGYVKNTLTLSNGNTHVATYRFRAKPQESEPGYA